MLHDKNKPLRLGISPCPNDTYIFDALINHRIDAEFSFETTISDVEELNGMSRAETLDIAKVSIGNIPEISEKYVLLDCGGAVGKNCGPLLVSQKPCTVKDLEYASIATPGLFTTANLLLSLNGACNGPRMEVVFDEVIPSVLSGMAEAGIIIHEERFTYIGRGLHKVIDLGEWWEEATKTPLPLGGIVVKRSLGPDVALAVQKVIRASLAFAWENHEASQDFMRYHAQSMDDSVMQEHIKTFVNNYSMDLGADGREAVLALVKKAAELRGLELPKCGIFLN